MTKQLAERHWKTATLKTLLAVFVLPTLLAAGCSTGGGGPGAGSQERESAEYSAEGAWPVVEVARKIEPCVVQVNVSSIQTSPYGPREARGLGSGEGEVDSPDNLLLWSSEWGVPPTWAALAQLVVPVVIMAAGAHCFVQSVEHIWQTIGVPAGFIALILAPLATELPEKFNSVYWLRGNKDPIAVGNISGATVLQSTVPVSLGLLFTPWTLDLLAGLAVDLALVAGSALFLMVRSQKALRGTWLVGGGLLYAAFVAAAIATILVQ